MTAATCPLCEAMCGIRVQTAGERIVSIRGNPDDPLSRGHICPKAAALADLHHDPDRVRTPLRRTAGGFVPVDWDTALREIAGQVHRLQAAHGRDAMASYLGNPNVHNVGSMLFVPELLRLIGTRNRFSATSVDQLPHMLAALTMFGHPLLMPVPDVDRTDFMVVLGANPLVSNGSILTAPDVRRRLDAVAARGRLVVIDPRRTETARRASAHHFLRPGTDAWLLLGFLRVLLEERGPRLHHLQDHVEGLEALPAVVSGLTLDEVEARTAVPAAVVRDLALTLADTERAVLYGRIGLCVTRSGGLNGWLVNLVNAVAGNLDRPGGLMVTEPAFDPLFPPGSRRRPRARFGRWRSRVRGLPEVYGELPVATLSEEIETPGEGQIRGLLVWAGNPVLSTPHGRRLDRALASLELLVAVDLYVTETSRHADWILPAAAPLARDHYDVAFHVLACRNTARFSPAVVAPDGDTRPDDRIAVGLGRQLLRVRRAPWTDRLRWEARARLGVRGLLDVGLRLGRYGYGRGGLSLARLRRSPEGLDLGPLTSCLLQRSPLERLRLAPPALVADVGRLRQEPDPPGVLLIGRRQLRSNNSWMHNAPRLMKGRDRCTLLVHPTTAASAGLRDGGRARVTSAVGSIEVPVVLTDDVMPGVVSLPHGWGHGREGVGWTVAAAHPGVSVNDVTDDQAVDPLSGNAVLNGVPVTLAAV